MKFELSPPGVISSKKNLILTFLFLSAILIIAASSYLNNTIQQLKHDRADDLKSIAKLKISQLTQWQTERYADAYVLIGSSYFRDGVEEFVQNPKPYLREKLAERLRLPLEAYNYKAVFVVSPDLKILLSVGDTINNFDKNTYAALKRAIVEEKITFTDFYYCETEKEIHCDIIAQSKNRQGKLAALVLLRVRPHDYLYPLIQTWPTPSKTSETLLLEKDGDSVRFLNELRHIKNSALRFTVPMSMTEVLGVKAALGQEGIYEGLDYRGEKVLGYISPVKGTDWFMVSKVDLKEIYAGLYYRMWLLIIITVVILVVIALGLTSLYQASQRKYYRELYEAEEEYKVTLGSIGDAVITTDVNGEVKYLNPVAENLTGWKKSEAIGKPLEEVFRIISEVTGLGVESPVSKVIKEGIIVGLANHTLLISRQGVETPIADSAAPIEDTQGNIIGVVLVFRDQTAEREAKKEILRLNRVYAVLSNINQTIVRAKNREELFTEICRIAVEDGKFMMAWIGLLGVEANGIEVASIAGTWNEKFAAEEETLSEEDNCKSIIEQAIISGERFIVNDFQSEAIPVRCRNEALKLGYKSAGSFPLLVNGKITGAINLFSAEKGFFNDEEIKLLEEMAADISLSLEMFEAEEKRKAAEEALAKSEKIYEDLYENSPDMYLTVDLRDFTILKCNDTTAKITGYTKAELLGKSLRELYHPRCHQQAFSNLRNFQQSGEVKYAERDVVKKDGSVIRVLLNSSPVYDAGGNIIQSRTIWRDITNLKKLEEEEKKLLGIIKESLNEIYVFEKESLRFIFVNDGALKNLGYTLEEMEYFTPFDIKPEFTEKTFRDALQPLISRKLDKYVFETKHQRKDGSLYDVEVHLQLLSYGGDEAFLAIIQDITDRKKDELALINQKEKFRRIISSSPLGIYIYELTPEGDLIFRESNPAADKIIGIKHQELIGKTIEEAFPLLKNTEVPDQYRKVARTGEPYFIQSFEYDSDSVKGTYQVHAFQSQPGFVVVMFQDVSERIKIEKELEENRRRLIFAQKIAKMGDFTWDIETGEINWSEGLYELLGYDPNEEINYDLVNREIHHPEDLEFITNWLNAAIHSNAEILPPNEYRIFKKNGEVIVCRTVGVVERGPDNKTKIFGIVQDITEIKKAEQAIKESETTFRKLYEESADPIMLMKDGRFISCNQATLKVLGLKNRSEIIDHTPMDISPEYQADGTDSHTAAMKYIETAQRDGYCRFEWVCLRSDGSPVILEVSLTPIILKGENLLHVGWRDITDRKRAEELVRKKSENLALLLETGNSLLTFHDTKSILEKVVESAVSISEVDSAAIYTLSNNTLFLECTYPPLPPEFPEEFRVISLEEHPFIHRAITSRAPEILTDSHTAELTQTEKLILEGRNLRSLLYLPLIYMEKPIGVLIVGTVGRLHTFSEDEIDVYRILASQTSLEIEETRMFEQNTRYVKELEEYIEARKRAEEEKEESEERFTKAFQNSPDGIIITSLADGKVVDANDTVLQMGGFTREEVVGKTTTELKLWNDPAGRDKFIAALLKDGSIINFETLFRKKSGELFTGLVSGEIIRLKKMKCILSVIRDITELKKAEEMLKQKMAELERFNKLSVGRELRMIELKKEINELHKQLGSAPPYNLDFADGIFTKN